MQKTQETRVQFLGWEDPPEEEMAAHSSILVWKIPWKKARYSPWGRTELDTTEQLHTCTHAHTHTHTHTHQCSLLLQTSGGNHGALSINSAPVINYRVDLGLERVRKASGPPLAGELLQSELESPPQGENVRFSPSLRAAWRGGWFILTPRHRFSFLTEHILVWVGQSLGWLSYPLPNWIFPKDPVWFELTDGQSSWWVSWGAALCSQGLNILAPGRYAAVPFSGTVANTAPLPSFQVLLGEHQYCFFQRHHLSVLPCTSHPLVSRINLRWFLNACRINSKSSSLHTKLSVLWFHPTFLVTLLAAFPFSPSSHTKLKFCVLFLPVQRGLRYSGLTSTQHSELNLKVTSLMRS